jgi:CheY-like chemotaxis protein
MSVILIVEDDEQVRVLAESVLRDAGCEVLAATALEGAQALLNSDQLIDLLFVDVNLGGDLEGRASNSAKRTGTAAALACRLHNGPRSGRW